MDNDYDVDMDDFAIFALYWGASGCGDCAGTDLIDDDIVDMLDVVEFTFWWLEGADN
ncbi:MAG: hypothetical protein KAY65_13505 [Planctomycetes bacterium]|nr:hypothetical protein [Planctomycetota bacterium]